MSKHSQLSSNDRTPSSQLDDPTSGRPPALVNEEDAWLWVMLVLTVAAIALVVGHTGQLP